MTKFNEKIGFDYKIEPNKHDVLQQFKHLFHKSSKTNSDEKGYS